MSDKRILDALFQKKCLSKSDYICLLDKYCPRNERDFWSRCLLAAGSGLVLAGIVCFFAANWSRLGDVLKLGLPLAGLVGCGLGAFWKGLEKTSAQAFVFGAAVLLGVFWAVFGQVYQTGAFVYEFFAVWVLCLLPLCLLARNKWLWLVTFYLAVIYWLNRNDSFLWDLQHGWAWLVLVLGGSAAWAVACWKKAGVGFERFIWVPLGIGVWVEGGLIMADGLSRGNIPFYLTVAWAFWLGQTLASLIRKETVLLGWCLLGLAGWLSLLIFDDLENRIVLWLFISGVLFVLAGVGTYWFWRRVRGVK